MQLTSSTYFCFWSRASNVRRADAETSIVGKLIRKIIWSANYVNLLCVCQMVRTSSMKFNRQTDRWTERQVDRGTERQQPVALCMLSVCIDIP